MNAKPDKMFVYGRALVCYFVYYILWERAVLGATLENQEGAKRC